MEKRILTLVREKRVLSLLRPLIKPNKMLISTDTSAQLPLYTFEKTKQITTYCKFVSH
jgi:hypothetical protein